MFKDISEFEKKINIDFEDKNLIEIAFIHRSYVNESNGKVKNHNERIEFLGDAVLELSATKFLYNKFPEKNEGEMTAYRSALVNTESLEKHAEKLSMGSYLKMSKGEKTSTKGRGHILANTFEAVIGAIYLDKGFDVVDDFLQKNLFIYIDEIVKNKLYKDSKSFFQEQAQEFAKMTPEYKLVTHEGPDHDRYFIMAVFLGDEKVAEGKGLSKQKAETEAAREGLKVKNWI